MPHGSNAPNPFKQVAEEFLLAVFILACHGLIALIAVVIGAGVHKVVDYFADPQHAPEVAGVTARYIIEGGEVILIAVVLGMGVISALTLFVIRLVTHLKG